MIQSGDDSVAGDVFVNIPIIPPIAGTCGFPGHIVAATLFGSACPRLVPQLPRFNERD
jgi:hypothetical protein